MDLRKIDALVAEHVMGWKIYELYETRYGDGRNNTEEGYFEVLNPQGFPSGSTEALERLRVVPHYSADIAAAWQVVKKIIQWKFDDGVYNFGLDYSARHHKGPQWMAGWERQDQVGSKAIIFGSTAPLAICLAALKAKGIEVPT